MVSLIINLFLNYKLENPQPQNISNQCKNPNKRIKVIQEEENSIIIKSLAKKLAGWEREHSEIESLKYCINKFYSILNSNENIEKKIRFCCY